MSVSMIKGSTGKKEFALLDFALFWLILDLEWVSWIFSQTVFSSVYVVYCSFSILFVLFLSVLLNKRIKTSVPVCAVWLPYVLFTIIGYFIGVQFQRMTYWFVFLVIVLISASSEILTKIPYRFILYGGIFSMIGVYVQFLFNSFYTANIKNLFTYEGINEFVDITEAFGMNGFTYQQGTTSQLIIFGLVILLFIDKELLPLLLRKPIIKGLLSCLMVLAIFLTGKRTISAVAVAVPILVFCFSKRRSNNKMAWSFVIIAVLLISYFFILPKALQSNDIFFFKRLSETLEGGSFDEMSSGRDNLWNLAINAFKENPLFGIGVGNYPSYSKLGEDAHNTYLQVLCEQGIFLFLFYVMAILFCLIYTLKLLGKVKDYSLCSFIRVSLAIQLVYISVAITGNVNVDSMPAMYFLSMAMIIRVYTLNKVVCKNRFLEKHEAVIPFH